MKTFTRLAFILLVATAVGASWVAWNIHGKNVRSARRLEDLRRKVTAMRSVDDVSTNRRSDRQVERIASDRTDVTGTLHAALQAAQAELTAAEQRANAAYQSKHAETAVEVVNSDPQRGLARLELLKNVGRNTPQAAIQTIAWAALHGDDATLLPALALTETARQKADALLATRLDGSNGYTPEKLASLYLVEQVLNTGAIEIVGCDQSDAQHATISIRRLETGGQMFQLPMVGSTDGWQLLVGDKAIDGLKSRMAEISARPEAANGVTPHIPKP